MRSKLYSEDGKPLYVIHTGKGISRFGGQPMEFFNVELSKKYKEVLKKGAEGKLGEVAKGVYFIPEHFHDMDDLADALYAKADDLGVVETTDREIAKQVMKDAPWSTLDPGSPQDILEELGREKVEKVDLEARKSSLDKARSNLLKAPKVK